MLLHVTRKNKFSLVGEGILDLPRVENKITEVMTFRGTFLSATEINAKFIISSWRVVGDADPYKASPFSDLL